MEPSAFSISLAVKDLEASKQFYQQLGFRVFARNQAQHWLILKNGDHGASVPRRSARMTALRRSARRWMDRDGRTVSHVQGGSRAA